jgi:hypothetical protein
MPTSSTACEDHQAGSFEVTGRAADAVGLLLLSQHVETSSVVRLVSEFRTGVGHLLRDRVSDLTAFADDVRRVAAGSCVLDPELVARLAVLAFPRA